jgi:hypothetical protein
MIPGTFNVFNRGGDHFDVMFARHDIPAGGPLKAHTVVGTRALERYLGLFDVQLTAEQVNGGRRGGFGERFISAQVYDRDFQ